MPTLMSQHMDYYTVQVGAADSDERKAFRPAEFAKYLALALAIGAGLVGLQNWNAPVPTHLAVVPKTSQAVRMPQALPRLTEEQAPEAMTSVVPAASAGFWHPASIATATAVANFLGPVGEAGAVDLVKGRTAALVHPAAMFALLALSLWTGYLGLQWKRARTIGQEITETKNRLTEMGKRLSGVQMKDTVKETVAAMKADGKQPSAADSELLANMSALELQVEALQAERKTLTAGNFRDQHFNSGSILLAVGVGSAIIGPVNTFIRTGKLFPGPHLYVGAAMTALWAIAAGLVPAMQKGNETARSIHVAANTLNILFFVWQVGTGLEIVGKVFEFTSWP